MKLTIGDIIKACGGRAQIFESADENFEVTGVYLDSRMVTEGAVFVAQKGERVDGHSFIGQVFEKGASLVICEKEPGQVRNEFGTDPANWGNYILVEDSLIALKKIARAYREKLEIPFVGITGSVGKTSTKEFVAGVLSEKYNVLKTEGNYNNEIGVPLTLLRIREEHEAAVVEMGISDFGEMTRLTEMVQPDIAVITNIGQCHLENLGTRDGILKAKTEIFGGMKKGGYAVLNGNDDKLITIGDVNGNAPLFFGEKGCGEEGRFAVSIESSTDNGLLGSSAVIAVDTAVSKNLNEKIGEIRDKISVNVPLPGHHMVINAAAATGVALLLGLKLPEIKSGIENMKPISGRNSIVTVGDITLIDDCYNANPVSMRSSIDLLMLAKGRKVAILGDMFELGEDEKKMHRGVGKYAAENGSDIILCAGELSRETFEGANDVLKEGREKNESSTFNLHWWKTRDELISAVKEDITSGERKLIPEGSAVLVKASHGMHFEEIVKSLKELF